jgi:hypothetical protein
MLHLFISHHLLIKIYMCTYRMKSEALKRKERVARGEPEPVPPVVDFFNPTEDMVGRMCLFIYV